MLNKKPTQTYDIFTHKEGSWKFTERVESVSTERAKRDYLNEHPEVGNWQVCVYHRK